MVADEVATHPADRYSIVMQLQLAADQTRSDEQ